MGERIVLTFADILPFHWKTSPSAISFDLGLVLLSFQFGMRLDFTIVSVIGVFHT